MCLYLAYPDAYPGLSGWFADHMPSPMVMILMLMMIMMMMMMMVAAGAYPSGGAILSTDKPWIGDSDRDVLYPALSVKVGQTL